MQGMVSLDTTDRFLALDAGQFTTPMAQALLSFSVTEEVKQRASELAEKMNFGTITTEERAEYLRLIELDELLSLVQMKAKSFLASKA